MNDSGASLRVFALPRDGLPLFRQWCDGLLARRVTQGQDRGGFLCPATGRVPGRSVDAVQPLVALFRLTNDDKYRQAALDVFDWAERNTTQPDGSWVNETDVPWKGITTFAALALGEALRHDGDLLPQSVRQRWRERLADAVDYLLGHMTFDTGDINYPLSTAATLAVAAKVLGDAALLDRARDFAHFVRHHLTPGGLIWGEGERGAAAVSPRGLRAIDITYNVEETLPNLATYAALAGDAEIERIVVDSLRAHLHFLLPDGAWDAGWSSRQYKWCYWGSATCDGAFGALVALRAHDPVFVEAAARNLDLLRRCTHEGLVHAGPGLHARGRPPLLHHTFVRAKALAAGLSAEASPADPSPAAALPSDAFDGLRVWPETGVVQFASGDWRATASINDIPQSPKRGGQPSGGALTLLWHRAAGPVCVASMNDYVRYESANMQTASGTDAVCLTPRIECKAAGRTFSNLYDRNATLETVGRDAEVTVRGTLCDHAGVRLPGAAGRFEITYRAVTDCFTIRVRTAAPAAALIVPVISPASEPVGRPAFDTVRIEKTNVAIVATTDGTFAAIENERGFNFVPGVEVLTLAVPTPPDRSVEVRLAVIAAANAAAA